MVNRIRNGGNLKSKSNQSPSIKKKTGAFKAKANVPDARQKIIQTKRVKVRDARDILANMARKQDARSKLQKIREKRRGAGPGGAAVQVIGSSILKKTDRNGKISLVTNKPKVPDLNVMIQQQLGLMASARLSNKKTSPKRPPPKMPFVPPVIRKTILNDYTPSVPSSYGYEPEMYKWVHPDIVAQKIEARRLNYTKYNAEARYPSSRPSSYIDLDAVEDIEMPLARPALKTSIHSRLDSHPSQQKSHGILSNSSKPKVVIPVGHRIVVSNLQGGVTEDDIRELFEDIGELLVARLVRPGTAEVIYKNLNDAQKAVETYHNRQLDGQPMKCLLVNKRPLNNPTAPAINTEGTRKIVDSNKLVPDLSTIHKVLFRRE